MLEAWVNRESSAYAYLHTEAFGPCTSNFGFGRFRKRKNEKEHMNGENGRKIPKVLYSFGRRARVEQRAISKEKWIFFPAGPGPAFSPKIRLIGSLQPLKSETPESVRRTVNAELHGGSCAAVKMN